VTGASASSLEEAARAKEAVRERIWALMERERVPCFPGATGRIPNFAGGPVAAACLPRSRSGGRPAWSGPP
jgi:hypothetical protein